MLVQAKQMLEGHPSGYYFDRMIKAGEIFEIPDTLVPHFMTDKDGKVSEEQAFTSDGVPLTDEKGKPTMKPVKQAAVSVGARNGGVLREYSELERRQLILAKNAIKGLTAEDKKLYLKYLEYSPVWMKPAPSKAVPTINKEVSSPESDINKLGIQDAVSLINKTLAIPVLKRWLEVEEEGQKREGVLGAIHAQLKNASGR